MTNSILQFAFNFYKALYKDEKDLIDEDKILSFAFQTADYLNKLGYEISPFDIEKYILEQLSNAKLIDNSIYFGVEGISPEELLDYLTQLNGKKMGKKVEKVG